MKVVSGTAVSMTDANGVKSPQTGATLALPLPRGCRSVTMRAITATGSPTYARYGLATLSAGPQAAGEGSKRFDLAGDMPIPSSGIANVYFAVDAGTVLWDWVFEVDETIKIGDA